MLVVGNNSVASVAEADAYLQDRANAEYWFSLPEDSSLSPGSFSKESLLVTSFRNINQLTNNRVLATSTDETVKTAQIELSLYYAKHLLYIDGREGPLNAGLVEYTIKSKSEKFKEELLNVVPLRVKNMLSSYYSYGGFLVDLKYDDWGVCE